MENDFPDFAPRKFFWLVGLYFVLHVVIRILISGTVDLDESEQMVLTQKFAWGYGSQPPLYTWLQIVFFHIFGVSIFALALLKNLLLFGIYSFTFLTARAVTRSNLGGVIAAICLLFIPQIVWESQRDLTHSVLAGLVTAATLFFFLRLQRNRWSDYIILGLCFGLGILSKYNVAAVWFGLILSALTLPKFRPAILHPKMLLACAVGFATVFPHLRWAMTHPEALFSTANKFQQETASAFFSIVARGTGNMLVAILFHIGPLLVILSLVFWKKLRVQPLFSSDAAKLLWRQYAFIIAGLFLAILILRVTGFKDRWFEPVFVTLPVLVVSLLPVELLRRKFRLISLLGSVVVVVVLLLIPGRIVFGEKLPRVLLLNAPFANLAHDLDMAIPSGSLILAENKWLAGNLRLQLPHRNVVTPKLARLFDAREQHCVLVWDATKNSEPASAFQAFVREFAGGEAEQPAIYFEKKYSFIYGKRFRLGVAELKK
ncbi:MAG: glycosyltransferase family 39 protein [Verrucomicrobiota bacterium]